MRALAIRRIPEFEPEEIEAVVDEEPSFAIGAHADYCREDFIFPRMQSRAMRDTPWGERAKPMKTWSEIAGIGLLFGLASCAIVVGTTFI
ncbi:MAG TPA: hypothetical protein VMD53_02285 [Rhizomicrobium sp.]|nr:hypothetical protein [Rhizomicrobium sp.]